MHSPIICQQAPVLVDCLGYGVVYELGDKSRGTLNSYHPTPSHQHRTATSQISTPVRSAAGNPAEDRTEGSLPWDSGGHGRSGAGGVGPSKCMNSMPEKIHQLTQHRGLVAGVYTRLSHIKSDGYWASFGCAMRAKSQLCRCGLLNGIPIQPVLLLPHRPLLRGSEPSD